MTIRFALLLGALLIAGCGGAPAPQPSQKKVTWAEYQKLAPELQDDPVVLDHLDDEAKKKLAESQRKKKR